MIFQQTKCSSLVKQAIHFLSKKQNAPSTQADSLHFRKSKKQSIWAKKKIT